MHLVLVYIHKHSCPYLSFDLRFFVHVVYYAFGKSANQDKAIICLLK